MDPAPDPVQQLLRCRQKLMGGNTLHLDELRGLWRLCHHPAAQIRESALILLTNPPVDDDIRHLKTSLDACLKVGPVRAREIPLPMLEQVFDIWEQAAALGIDPVSGSGFRALLQRLPLRPLLELVRSPYSLKAFLPQVAHRVARLFFRRLSSRQMNRWRRLRIHISRRANSEGWQQPTFGDLPSLHALRAGSGRVRQPCGRWLQHCRPLVFRAAASPLPEEIFTFKKVRWAGLGNLTLAWMDRLLDHQCREIESIRSLAHEASRRTRRVVFSWHNAALAAAGGWGFEDLEAMFPSPALWEDFVRAVGARESAFLSNSRDWRPSAKTLLSMRESRLAIPALCRALHGICSLNRLDPAWERVCRDAQGAAAPMLVSSGRQIEAGFERHAWTGSRSPGERRSVPGIVAWWQEERKHWVRGLVRLAALAAEAESRLARGDLESFVLPWIDKFFMSSLRLTDAGYLVSLIRWIEDRNISPLILFWEDTIHAAQPSFRLVLDSMRAEGLPFQGIGVFDEGASNRAHALDHICSLHEKIRLFALRPWDDTHTPAAFHRMLKERDFGFFARYDSSWKDDLNFLYVGTQVFPLLSGAGCGETLPAWAAAGPAKYALGHVLRQILRRRALGKAHCDSEDALSARYAAWASLR
jgi:hypothetical protein